MTRNMEELTTGTNVTTWVPVDSYVDTIIEASVSYGQLSGVISVVDHDMQACEGKIIQVRYVRARTAQGPKAANTDSTDGCLSATSQTIGTQEVQITKWGDYDKLEGFAEFETCGPIRAQILNEMAKGLAKKRDQVVWAEIMGCEANTTFTTREAYVADPTVTGSCCTFGFDLYNKIVQAINHLAGDSLRATHIIMHPTVSQYLYFKENGVMPNFASSIQYDSANGQIRSILGVNVIESPNVTTGASSVTLVAVIDAGRACIEAWGKRPTFTSKYEPDCDYTKETVWMYWNASEIEGSAVAGKAEGIVHILSA